MNQNQIEIGEIYTYFPKPASIGETPHFPAVVQAVGKLIKVKLYTREFPDGITRSVSAKRLEIQQEVLPPALPTKEDLQ